MKKITLIALVLGSVLSFYSCKDYLDLNPTAAASDKLVWSKTEYADLAVNYFYHDLGYFGSYNSGQSTAGMTEGFTDMLKYSSMTYNAYMYIPNELAYGGTALTANYVNVYLGSWSTVYTKIRRVNEALYNLQQYGTLSANDTERLEAELRFFRAFLYFDLIKRYKEVIIYDQDLNSIASNKSLSSETAGWDFVEADLRYAGEKLPVSANAKGRITSGGAYGFMSRAMLYAERWEAAQFAAEKVLGMSYALTPNYADAFKDGNSEAIIQYSYDRQVFTHGFDLFYSPGGDKEGSGAMGTPTQEMVESYELAGSGGFPDWSTWHTTTGTTSTPPYALLEPRFQATVLYNGATWKGRKIEPFVGGKDGYATWKVDAVPAGRTVTGYYLKKLLDESIDLNTENSNNPWMALRLAEVLLNHAEASYHAGEPAKANDAIRRIRSRVGLPYTDKSGSALLDQIRQERKVELAYEGQYYWDMRRWKLAQTAFTGNRVHGLKIEKNGSGQFVYTYVDCDQQDRNFPQRMYRYPLPVSEINNNTSVQQFPEWN